MPHLDVTELVQGRPLGASFNFPDVPHIQRFLGGPWSMHLPFAYDLIREIHPRVFVELGVYKGESYFAFCQSVVENGLNTQCYGIDTWRGDIHAGLYGPELGAEVSAYNTRYAKFSHLLAMTFEQAVSQFGDGSIDLLHIDGAHRYEDVKRDFDSWKPKLSKNAVVLFHDVLMRDRGFGVFKLWQEIARPGASFEFEFGHGLGVWRAAGASKSDSPFLRALFRANAAKKREISSEYALKAAAVRMWARTDGSPLENHKSITQARVFAPRDGAASDERSSAAEIFPGEWHRVKLELPWGIGDGTAPIRFDPIDRAGVVDIAGVSLRSRATSEFLWRTGPRDGVKELQAAGTALRIPHHRVLRLFSYGEDPQIFLPSLSGEAFEEPLLFEAWLRFDPSAAAMERAVKALNSKLAHDPNGLEAARLSEPSGSAALDIGSAALAGDASVSLSVYAASASGYAEDRALEIPYTLRRWAHLHIALEHGLGTSQLRFDPLVVPGIIDIAGVALKSAVTGEVLWKANGDDGLEVLIAGGSAIRIPHPRLARFFSYGEDPQIYLPHLAGPEFDGPLRLELWLKVETGAEAIRTGLTELVSENARALTQIHETQRALEETTRGASDKNSQLHARHEQLRETELALVEAKRALELQRQAAEKLKVEQQSTEASSQRERTEYAVRISQLENELSKAEVRRGTEAARVLQLEDQLSTASMQRATEAARVSQLEDELSRLRADLQRETEAVHRSEETTSRVQKEISVRERQIEDLKHEVAAIAARERVRDLDLRRANLLLADWTNAARTAEAALLAANQQVAARAAEVDTFRREMWHHRVRAADFAARARQEQAANGKFSVKGVIGAASGKNDKSRKERPASKLSFAIDSPVTWRFGCESIEVSGWCFATGGGPLAGVRVKIGRTARYATYGLPREDVAHALGMELPERAECGFATEIKLPIGVSILRLDAIVQGEAWQTFFERDIERLQIG